MDASLDVLTTLAFRLAKAERSLSKTERERNALARKLKALKRKRLVRWALKTSKSMKRLRSLLGRLAVRNDPFARLLETAGKLPKSNGSRFYVKRPVKIGIVCDQFMWDALSPAAEFIYIRPAKSSFETLESLDLLLVVSTFRGLKEEEWRRCSKPNSPQFIILCEMMTRARAIGKPVAFYSKEDPVHYLQFLDFAKRADFIFTTARESVTDYCRDCGHSRVFPLEFCLNPLLHNPIGRGQRIRGVLFAGSWMGKSLERCAALTAIFRGVRRSGLPFWIFDRRSSEHKGDVFAFPDEFKTYVKPSVGHDVLQSLHKSINWAINVNTVTESETMFAARVRELLANGTLLVSNRSKGMERKFPEVFVAEDEETVRRILGSDDEPALSERRFAGIRRVMTGETCYDRIDELLARVGFRQEPRVRRILVVCDRVTPKVREYFDRQTYPHRKLVSREALTEGEYLQMDIVAFFVDGVRYPMHYLEDLSNAFKYVNVDFVTDGGGAVQNYVPRVADVSRTIFWRESLPFACLANVQRASFAAGGYCV